MGQASKFKLFYILFCSFICFNLSLSAKGIDTNYIKSYSDRLILKTYSTYAKTYMPYNLPKKLPTLDFTTNSFITLGFGFSYKWFGLRYGFNIIQLGDPALYDKTSSLDIYMNAYLPKHLIDVMFTNHDGFYNSNPKLNLRHWNDSIKVPPKVSNLRTYMIGTNYLYVFNGKKFSFKSSFTQSEQQIKSSGSFLVGASFNYFSINSDSSLIPKDYIKKDSLSPTDEYLNGIFIGPSIRAGYAYNLIVYKNVSLLVSATPGISLEYNKYITNKGKTEVSMKPNFQGNFRVGLTYSQPNYFFGINAFNDIYFHNLRDANFKYTTIRLELFLGIRLTPFRFMAPKPNNQNTLITIKKS